MAKTPKNASLWEMNSVQTSRHIMGGALLLQAEPIDGSGWTKFKAHIVGVTTLKLKGEFDSVEAALKAAETCAYQLLTKDIQKNP